jgi:hypothetical protein
MQNMGGLGGLMGMMPGIAKMKNQIAAANLDDKVVKRQVAVIDSMTREERKNPDVLKASRKKRIAAGAGLQGRGTQQAAQDAPEHGRHDEGHGSGQARARSPASRRRWALAEAACRRPKQMKALAAKMPGGIPQGAPSLPKDFPNLPEPACRALPKTNPDRVSGKPGLPGLGIPGQEEIIRRFHPTIQNTLNGELMSVVIRLARAGTKKRPVYHVVVADSRFPRDGRFIERLGYFNPLLPKDSERASSSTWTR